MSASTRVAVAAFWEYLAFALNSLIFLLIGFQIRLEALLAAWKPIVVAYLAVTLGRAVVTYGVAFLLARTRERFPMSWASVLTWGGLRGALSMVLVLGLPGDFRHRELVVSMTFGVVVLSILVQGLTMGPLLKRLGLVGTSEARATQERLRGTIRGGRAALAEIERMDRQQTVAPSVLQELRSSYEERVRQAEEDTASLDIGKEELLEEDRLLATRQALLAEKDALSTAFRSGSIAEESFEHLVADVDARLFELESEDGVSPAARPDRAAPARTDL